MCCGKKPEKEQPAKQAPEKGAEAAPNPKFATKMTSQD
jgi:hypothetical protein